MNIDFQQLKSKLDAGGYTFKNPVVSQFHEDYMNIVSDPLIKKCPNCQSETHERSYDCDICGWEFGFEGGGPDKIERPRYRIYFRDMVKTPRNMEHCYCVHVEFPEYHDFYLESLNTGYYWCIAVPLIG